MQVILTVRRLPGATKILGRLIECAGVEEHGWSACLNDLSDREIPIQAAVRTLLTLFVYAVQAWVLGLDMVQSTYGQANGVRADGKPLQGSTDAG